MADMAPKKATACYPYMNYKPLPDGYVRLLRVQPPEDPRTDLEAEIEISLTTVPLAECPPYVTLSYTWADPEPFVDPTNVIFTKVPRCYPIKCDNRLILCTRNLRNALRRLRQLELVQKSEKAGEALREHAGYEVTFNANVHLYWIDAVCIDQNDLQERSKQVSLMNQIYRRSQCTIVWYGEADGYTKPAVQVLLKVSGTGTPSPNDNFDASDFKHLPNFMKEIWQSLDDTAFEAFCMFMARKWILRTWILQEVVLSPRVWIMCGTYSFALDLLLRAATSIAISKSSKWSAPRFSEILAKRGLPDLHHEIVIGVANAQSTLAMIYGSRQRLRDNNKPNFLDAITMSASSKATDLHDKIFGVLGLADSGGTAIYKPDYEKTVAEVYISATAFVIKARGDLACFRLVGDFSSRKIMGLPSWCPDYSSPVSPLRDTSDIGKTWRLGHFWSDTPNLEITDTSMLIVDGSRYDIVTETSALRTQKSDIEIPSGLSAVFNIVTQLEDRGAANSSAR